MILKLRIGQRLLRVKNAKHGKWLNAPAGFLRKDNSCKPAYDEMLKLIKQDWWTTNQLITDSEGNVTFTGFLGNYEVICGSTKATFELDKSGATEVIILK